MNIKTLITSVAILFSTTFCYAQSSVSLTAGMIDYEFNPGTQLGLKLKTPLKTMLYFTGESKFFRLHNKRTTTITSTTFAGEQVESTTESQTQMFAAQIGLEYALFAIKGISINAGLSGGLIKDPSDYFGIIQGEISLEGKISDHIAIGVPINYSFVTWRRDSIAALGFRISYLY